MLTYDGEGVLTFQEVESGVLTSFAKKGDNDDKLFQLEDGDVFLYVMAVMRLSQGVLTCDGCGLAPQLPPSLLT